MTDWIFSSASAMAAAVRNKSVSAAELVTLHLQRIEAVNPSINAVVQLAADRAMREAELADAALSRGDLIGPLHGVPVTIKDSLDTEGIVTAAGTRGRVSHVPMRDAVAVARLRLAGAIILGKSNTSELTVAGTTSTNNPVYGRTNNPYDLDRSTSASSGGAAAIVAAGGSPLDLGSDTGGSIRDPAHHCGIAGIKPTSGRVPKTGHVVSYGLGPLDFLTQVGPMARYVEDLVLALPLICGPDGRDPGVVPMPFGDPGEVDQKALRVTTWTDNGASKATPEVANCVEAAAQSLMGTVAEVEEAVPGVLKDAGELGRQIRSGDGFAWLRRLLEQAGTREEDSTCSWMLADAKPMLADDYADVLARVENFRSEMLQFMEKFDAIVCPVVSRPAEPHDITHEDDFDDWINMGAFNLTGYPAAVVRAGTTGDGLPIGVQIVGRPWREDVVLSLASHVEQALGGYRRPKI